MKSVEVDIVDDSASEEVVDDSVSEDVVDIELVLVEPLLVVVELDTG